MEAAFKDPLPAEPDDDTVCEQLCRLALCLKEGSFSQHLKDLARQGAHLYAATEKAEAKAEAKAKPKPKPRHPEKHSMDQERTLSSVLCVMLAKALNLGIIHQACLGEGATHADGAGTFWEDVLKMPQFWRIVFLMECKRSGFVVSGNATEFDMVMDQIANEWHRLAVVFNARAMVAFVTDEFGMVAYVVCESNEYFRAHFSALLDPYGTATATAPSASAPSASAPSASSPSASRSATPSSQPSSARVGVSAVIGFAAWTKRKEVKRLVQQARAVQHSIRDDAEPCFPGPTLPQAVLVSIEQGLLAAKGPLPTLDEAALCQGLPEEAGDETRLRPQAYTLVELLSSCASRWVKNETQEEFVVKVFDHTTRRPPTKLLLASFVDAAVELKHEGLHQFYSSWRVTEIGPDVAILTYRWIEMAPVSVQDVATMLELYRAVFATPRKLSASEEVESKHCHGDSLKRNCSPPALLDLDFVGPEGTSYPLTYCREGLDRHPAVEDTLKPMRLEHDLWGFGVALTEWFPLDSGAHQVGQDLKDESRNVSGDSHRALDKAIRGLKDLPSEVSQHLESRPSTAPTVRPNDQFADSSPETRQPRVKGAQAAVTESRRRRKTDADILEE